MAESKNEKENSQGQMDLLGGEATVSGNVGNHLGGEALQDTFCRFSMLRGEVVLSEGVDDVLVLPACKEQGLNMPPAQELLDSAAFSESFRHTAGSSGEIQCRNSVEGHCLPFLAHDQVGCTGYYKSARTCTLGEYAEGQKTTTRQVWLHIVPSANCQPVQVRTDLQYSSSTQFVVQTVQQRVAIANLLFQRNKLPPFCNLCFQQSIHHSQRSFRH